MFVGNWIKAKFQILKNYYLIHQLECTFIELNSLLGITVTITEDPKNNNKSITIVNVNRLFKFEKTYDEHISEIIKEDFLYRKTTHLKCDQVTYFDQICNAIATRLNPKLFSKPVFATFQDFKTNIDKYPLINTSTVYFK